MKKLWFFTISFWFLWGYVGAQTPDERKINFVKDSVNLGNRNALDTLSYTFEFEVGSYTPVAIDTVISDCACSTAYFPKETLQKGEVGVIHIEFWPYKYGHFDKKFTVKLKNSKQKIKLSLTGKIEPPFSSAEKEFPIVLGPLRFEHQLINLGTVDDQNVVKRFVRLYNSSEDSLAFSKEIKHPEHIGLIVNTDQIPPQSVSQFELFYDPVKKGAYGYNLDQLTFTLNDSSQTRIDLTVAASIQPVKVEDLPEERPRLHIFNPDINLGKIKLADYQVVTIKLINQGEKDLLIHRVETNHGSEVLQLSSEKIGTMQSAKLEVKFLDIGKEGKQDRKITIYSNDPEKPTQQVIIRADVGSK